MAAFTPDFMQFNFEAPHKQAIGDDPAQNGYPDDGNGRYMQAQTYAHWYFMNVAKRQKMNGHEAMVTMAPLSLVNGAFFPLATMGLVGAHSLGRYLYVQGYIEKEGAANQQRIAGAVLCHSSNFFTMATSLFLGVQLARGRFPQLAAKAAFKLV